MSGDSQFDIRRELARQRGRLVALLDLLDDKNLAKQYRNAALQKRRRYYEPKNNGRGRPAKRLQTVSKEDEARRVVYVAELALLDEAIAFNASHADRLKIWLATLKEEVGEGEYWRARQRKIGQLLRQFGERRPESMATERKWRHEDVRDYVTILHNRQTGRVKAFERLPVSTIGQQDEEDAERAKLAVLERFCTSNHLVTAQIFRQRAPIIRRDVHCLCKPHDRQVYRDAWFREFDKFVDDLTSRYAAS